jgi:hypothetical protein
MTHVQSGGASVNYYKPSDIGPKRMLAKPNGQAYGSLGERTLQDWNTPVKALRPTGKENTHDETTKKQQAVLIQN